MKVRNSSRLFIALSILLSGMALVPYIGLSSQPFGWQQFADVYEPAPVAVSIQDSAFVPGTILVSTGTTVRWTNHGNLEHTVTSSDGSFDSETLDPGESFEYRFDTPGTFAYFCSIHPNLTGKVIVADQGLDVYLPVILR